MPGVKRNLTTLSMEDKHEALIAIENKKLDRKGVCEKYNIANTTLSGWLANKDKIFRQFELHSSAKRMRVRNTEHLEVEEALLEWLREARQNALRVNAAVLQAQAVYFAAALDDKEFKGSLSWVNRFCERNNVVLKEICGDEKLVDEEVVRLWRERDLPRLVEGYAECDVFNGDETGLFYNAGPSKTLTLKGDKCCDGKNAKDRLSILLNHWSLASQLNQDA